MTILRGYDAWKTREPQIYDERCDDCGRRLECTEVNLGARNILWLCQDCLAARREHYEQDHDEDE